MQFEEPMRLLLDEALANDQQLFVAAVLEPDTESDLNGTSGKLDFSLSCACVCKVLQAKPYPGDGKSMLVRVRGEARVRLSSLQQVQPYMRAELYHMPDAPILARDLGSVSSQLEQLRAVMRDIQNLCSKFRCDETAAVQQAMRWCYANQQSYLHPAVMKLPEIGVEQQDVVAATQREDGTDEHENEEDVAEAAARLSFAAFQMLPQASHEVRHCVFCLNSS